MLFFKKVYVDLDMQSLSKIKNLPTPTSTGDAASKSYVDAAIVSVNATAFKYMGVIDASTSPNYPSAVVGDVYVISVAGKIGGTSGITVEAGDSVLCSEDNAGGTQASVGSKFNISQSNLDAAAMAGDGLSNVGNTLAVSVDGATVEISSDALRVKDAGITAAKLATDAVETAKIKAAAVTKVKLATNAKPFDHAFVSGDFTGGTTLTIADATHALGDKVTVLAVLDSSGNVVECGVSVNDATGAVVITVLNTLAFDGTAIIAPRA